MLIRPATVNDAAILLELKNEQIARFWSGVREEISPTTHDVWLEHALVMPELHSIWIAEKTPLEKVGYGRLQVTPEVEVSLAVQDGYRGEGIGAQILVALEQEARKRKYPQLAAYVHSGNYPSLRAFARQGYVLADSWIARGVMWQVLRKDLR